MNETQIIEVANADWHARDLDVVALKHCPRGS